MGDSLDAINSIGRSAAERRSKPMTSVFYDVIRLESVRGTRTLECAYRRPFLTVFLEFEPQNFVGHRVDPQKALPYITARTLSHCAPKYMHGSLQ